MGPTYIGKWRLGTPEKEKSEIIYPQIVYLLCKLTVNDDLASNPTLPIFYSDLDLNCMKWFFSSTKKAFIKDILHVPKQLHYTYHWPSVGEVLYQASAERSSAAVCNIK